MKILLSNHSLTQLGGTETWVKTMYDELVKEHEVHVYTPNNTLFPEIPPFEPETEYDLALINHNVCLKALGDAKIKCRVYTCHGIIPVLERPIKGADVYVSVSEEVQEHISKQGFESVVIRNPIDMQRFKPRKPVNRTLRKVLFLSTHGGDALQVIKQACEDLELNIISGGQDPVEAINEADLVIGLGRCAYEAMSCNRNVIIFDYRGGDGFVDNETIYDYRLNNCSGRRNKLFFSPGKLRELFDRYDPSLHLRNYIRENNDVKHIARAYLALKRK